MKARVYRSSQREFYCKLVESGEMINAKALGNLLKHGNIVVGDYVEVEKEGSEYQISSVKERASEVFRILTRESKKKVTASNCDVLIITTSVSKPNFKRGVLDRFILRSIQWQIHPIIVFNKMDEYDPESFDIQFEQDRLAALGIKCFEVSAVDSNYPNCFLDYGWEDLQKYIKGKTALFLGHSGVGKSEIINGLSGGDIELKTKRIGRKTGKGSHTTTWSEIIDFKDFSLIDSPGIKSFSLEDFDPDELINYFPDLFDIASKCQFRDCSHLPESKGCAFYELDKEDLETDYIFSRLDSYLRFHEEVSQNEKWEKKY